MVFCIIIIIVIIIIIIIITTTTTTATTVESLSQAVQHDTRIISVMTDLSCSGCDNVYVYIMPVKVDICDCFNVHKFNWKWNSQTL